MSRVAQHLSCERSSTPSSLQAANARATASGRAVRRNAAKRLEQRRGLGRWFETEERKRVRRGHTAPGRALEEAALEQVGLVDVLDGVLFLPHRDRQRGQADRAAAEFLADRGQDLAVEAVQAEVVDLELAQRGVG